MKTYYTLILLILSTYLFSQNDSLQLELDELGMEDIYITKEDIAKNKVFTASRTINTVDEMPLSIYVVTGEEILRNGYFTLTDVLKSVPGIFVSQPGSAIEGETFLINGLRGNREAKIMINNINVRPENILGMPIGHQLPIRQAERVEITIGPSSVIHGTNAGAATINIVTRKSERPVYIHADLGSGIGGFNTVNVLFGGKLGKNKNILKFNAYGGITDLRDTKIPKYYPVDPSIYPGYLGSDETDIRSDVDFPHESRQFGVAVDFRSFHLSVMRMERRDHAAVGSNPLAVSYKNPQTTFGEQIIAGKFSFQKDFKAFGITSSVDYIDYSVDKSSSVEYGEPFVKQLAHYIADETALGDTIDQAVFDDGINEIFDGRKYFGGRLAHTKAEQLLSIFPFKNLELVFGANAIVETGTPIRILLEEQLEFNTISGSNRVSTNVFGKAYLTFNKFNVILGINKFKNIVPVRKKILPQLAVLYKPNPTLNFRASYSTSYVVPPDYYAANSGSLFGGSYVRTALATRDSESEYKENLQPQITEYAEIGVRWNLFKKLKLDAAVFGNRNKNLMVFDYDKYEGVGSDNFFGYRNEKGLSAEMVGFRGSIIARDIIKRMRLNAKFHYSYYKGRQELLGGETFNRVLSQPDYISGFNVSFRLYRKLFMAVEGTIIGKRASTKVTTVDDFYFDENLFYRTENFRRARYFLMDIAFNLELNNNFRIFAKVNNLGDNSGGLDAYGTPDDLFSNVPVEVIFRAGMSYTIN